MAFSTRQANMDQPAVDLIGYKIDLLVGSGSYSTVYRLVDDATGSQFACKIANRKDEVVEKSDVQFPTAAWMAATDMFAEAQPEPSDLLERQYARCSGIECSGWATVHEVRIEEGRAVAIMDWVDAANLRDLMVCSSYGLDVLERIARALHHLIDSGLMLNHGDLKPENILLANDGTATLIDPGYFGPVAIDSSQQVEAFVTTWQYYPSLKPNDMFAFGLLMLELCAGVHPFLVNLTLKSDRRLGAGLQAYVDQVAGYGNQFVRNIERLPAYLDRFGTTIPVELKEIALTCMGMEEGVDGTLDLSSSFESFREVVQRLSEVEFPETIPNFTEIDFQPEGDEGRPGDLSNQPLIVSSGIPTGLTVVFGEQRARVRQRVRIGKSFRIAISPESEGEDSANVSYLSIFRFLQDGPRPLIALTLPPEYTLEDPYLSIWFARIVDRKFLVPVPKEETDRIRIDDLKHPSERQLVALIGEFEEQATS